MLGFARAFGNAFGENVVEALDEIGGVEGD